jgi:hypothetical protein
MFDVYRRGGVWAVKAAVLGFCLMALSACASVGGFPDDVIPADTDLTNAQQYFDGAIVADYLKLTSETDRRPYRDRIVYGRLHAYDVQYKQFLKALSLESGSVALGADLVSLAFSGLAATTGDAPTKAALAAVSGGVLGAKGNVSKDVFYDKALPAIVAQMEASRLQVRLSIEKGLADTDANYSLMKAMVDLDQYELAGSLPGALNAIVKDAGVKADKAERDITFTRDATFVGGFTPMTTISGRVNALTDAKALAVAKAMELVLPTRSQAVQDFIHRLDPSGKRLKDGTAAKAVLKAWIVLDDRDATSQGQWTAALDAAG